MFSHIVQHAIALGMQTASLTLWLMILTIVFLPLERFFALHPRRVRTRTLASDLAYYFPTGLTPAILLTIPIPIMTAGAHRITPHVYLTVLPTLVSPDQIIAVPG